MVSSFGPDTPVLAPARTAYQGRHAWLLWPALQYRVVTPFVYEPAVNTFQRAMLGLARVGQRDLETMASLLGLEPEFAGLVRDDLRTLEYLDEYGALTPDGARALNDGFLDPKKVVVTHVYQDFLTGALWPAAVPAPMLVGARWADRHWADVDLGTAGDGTGGDGTHVRVLAIPADGEPPEAPSADDVVEAVSRGSQAAASGSGTRAAAADVDADAGVGPVARAQWPGRPPERVAARVSLMAAGQPVYLPVAIVRIGGGKASLRDPVTWLAFSPFGNRASQLLRRLIAIRCSHFPPLRRRVENLTGQPPESLLAEFDQLQASLREYYGGFLDRRFGPGLRANHEVFELLTLLEVHLGLARKTEDHASELNTAANVGWRIQEVVLDAIYRRHPPTDDTSPSDDTPPGIAAKPTWHRLMTACEAIGLRATEYTVIGNVTKLTKIFRMNEDLQAGELLAAVVLSAQQGDADHPVRRLAAQRDTLLTDLRGAFSIRNDASHAEVASLDIGAVELSRRLAHETVAAFLGVLAPDDAPDDTESPDSPEGP